MNKQNVSVVTGAFAFILSFLGSINVVTVPVKKDVHENVVAVSNHVNPAPNMSISLSGRCARANKDNMCGSKRGEWCMDDNDCCSGKCGIPAGADEGTCQ